MPSTCTARLTRAYTSTLYTSRCPTKHNLPCNVLELKCGGLLFDRHKTPLTRRFVVYYCSAVYRSNLGSFRALERVTVQGFELSYQKHIVGMKLQVLCQRFSPCIIRLP